MSSIKWVIATHNPGKLLEIKALLADWPVELLSQAEFGIGDVDETEDSFVGNALLKARWVSQQTGLPALADDSGLEVVALNGAPGIYSARYAGEPVDFQKNIDKLLHALDGVTDRRARFRSVCAFVRHAKDPTPLIAEGTWAGEILTARCGRQGFGYDPVFYIPSLQCSAAELTFADKNRLSHRAQALQQLHRSLQQILSEGV